MSNLCKSFLSFLIILSILGSCGSCTPEPAVPIPSEGEALVEKAYQDKCKELVAETQIAEYCYYTVTTINQNKYSQINLTYNKLNLYAGYILQYMVKEEKTQSNWEIWINHVINKINAIETTLVEEIENETLITLANGQIERLAEIARVETEQMLPNGLEFFDIYNNPDGIVHSSNKNNAVKGLSEIMYFIGQFQYDIETGGKTPQEAGVLLESIVDYYAP